MKAAQHNASSLLRELDYGFQNFVQAHTGSTLAFGSEFCPVEQLHALLWCHHPSFDELAEILITGMPYRYSKEITETG